MNEWMKDFFDWFEKRLAIFVKLSSTDRFRVNNITVSFSFFLTNLISAEEPFSLLMISISKMNKNDSLEN